MGILESEKFLSLEVSPVRLLVMVGLVVGGLWGYSTIYAYSVGAWEDSLPAAEKRRLAEATFAGGCFWCMEPPFEKLDGVREVMSGFAGGDAVDPAYEEVASGATNHVESVRVYYDAEVVSYRELLAVYWRQIDPTDAGGQFVDRGEQYTSRIFYHDARQRRLAEQSRRRLADSGIFAEPLVTGIEPAESFYPAARYHQNYYQKNPIRYAVYRYRSGRDAFLEEAWSGHRGFELFPGEHASRLGDGVRGESPSILARRASDRGEMVEGSADIVEKRGGE